MKAILAMLLALTLLGSCFASLKALEIPQDEEPNITIKINPDIVKLPPPEELPDETECVGCEAAEEFTDILDENVTSSCDPSLLDYPDHESYSGGYINVDEPDYLAEATIDCSLYGRDDEITQDLEEKLAILDAIEAELNETEEDADEALSDGEDALECIGLAAHGLESASSYGGQPGRENIGGSHDTPTSERMIVTYLEDFYQDLAYVYTAKNYTDAAMMSLESLSDGLEENCMDGKCMYPEDKEHYEDLLEYEHDGVSHYAGRTRAYIGYARVYAQNYYDLKDNYINRDNCFEMVSEQQPIPELVDYSNATDQEPVPHEVNLTVIDPSALADQFEGVQNITYDDEENKYVVTSKVKRKLLWLFDVDVEVITEVDAQNGSIMAEEMPFWSFLLTD